VQYYNYSLDLPHTKIKLYHRELNTQEQIMLAKANLTIANTKDSLIDFHNFVLDILQSCVKNYDDIQKITIIEYVLFLVKLRILSVGNSIDFLLKDTERKTKIQINLKEYLSNLYNASTYFENNNILTENNITIKLNWPKLKSIMLFSDFLIKEKNIYESINESIQEFIESIVVGDKIINFEYFNNKEKSDLLDKLPTHLKVNIQNKVFDALKQLVTYDIFTISTFKEQKFNIYNLSFIEHIKLFFTYDIKSIYSEIYFLCNCKLTPEYILGLSPSERKIYISMIQDQNKKDKPGSEMSDAIKDLALEFGEVV
jgi:hypothetical protein